MKRSLATGRATRVAAARRPPEAEAGEEWRTAEHVLQLYGLVVLYALLELLDPNLLQKNSRIRNCSVES